MSRASSKMPPLVNVRKPQKSFMWNSVETTMMDSRVPMSMWSIAIVQNPIQRWWNFNRKILSKPRWAWSFLLGHNICNSFIQYSAAGFSTTEETINDDWWIFMLKLSVNINHTSEMEVTLCTRDFYSEMRWPTEFFNQKTFVHSTCSITLKQYPFCKISAAWCMKSDRYVVILNKLLQHVRTIYSWNGRLSLRWLGNNAYPITLLCDGWFYCVRATSVACDWIKKEKKHNRIIVQLKGIVIYSEILFPYILLIHFKSNQPLFTN